MRTWRCCHRCSLLIADGRTVQTSSPSPLPGGGSGDEHNSLPVNGQGVDLVSQARRPKEHLEDLQKACVLRWRGCEGTTKERRVLQASSGEDAGIRALLSRIGARRAEGGHRFARVYSCRSALPTRLHPPTLIFERLGCCAGCIRAVGCYAGQTICMEDPTA